MDKRVIWVLKVRRETMDAVDKEELKGRLENLVPMGQLDHPVNQDQLDLQVVLDRQEKR